VTLMEGFDDLPRGVIVISAWFVALFFLSLKLGKTLSTKLMHVSLIFGIAYAFIVSELSRQTEEEEK
jgi:hypothetical protein